jgi:hypothetical protein
MSKAIEGAVLIGAAVGLVAFGLFVDPWLFVSPAFDHAIEVLFVAGVGLELAAAAQALTSTQGSGYTERQAAAFRQIIYGTQRVGGIFAYLDTTGGKLDQNNFIIVLAGHEVDAIENLYLDGRQVFWDSGSHGNTTRNGCNFGGNASNSTHTGPGGTQYNFGTLVYCEPRFGDQTATSAGPSFPGGWSGKLITGNSTTWDNASDALLLGCTYVYLKLEYDTAMFPNTPGAVEVKFTIRGKNDIWDPRTGTKGYTSNAALICADVVLDPKYGLGDVDAFKDSGSVAQLIAAANVCDEQVLVEALSDVTPTYEARYSCHFHYDTSVAPGDALTTMMQSMGGRVSMPGGEWYFYPAYWQGPSFTFDAGALAGPLQWTGRSLKDLYNRVNGTYIAPNFPWNVAGNLYDANGFFSGSIQNNFAYAFTPTSAPQFASDVNHGYAEDAYLEADSLLIGAYDSGTSYKLGDVVSEGTGASKVMYKSLVASNLGNDPASSPTDWVPYSNLLPLELTLRSVLSVTQWQRLAKIALLRNRFQGSGTLTMMQKAFAMQSCDVMSFDFPAMGWSGKTLEIQGATSSIDYGDDKTAPMEKLTMKVAETDISVYEWDPTTEEMTVYGVPANTNPTYSGYPPPPPVIPSAIAPPTSLAVTSSNSTAIVGSQGQVTPALLATWTAPADARVTGVLVEFAVHGSGTWLSKGVVSPATTSFTITPVTNGTAYDVRLSALASLTGGISAYDEVDNTTATASNSQLSTYSNSPALALTQPTSTTIHVAAVAVTFGGVTVNYAARTLTISAPSVPTWYYVTIADPTQAGESGSPTLTATASTSTALVGVLGDTYMGAILALPAGSAVSALAGGWPAPQTIQVI